jgi:hypothetical protein
MAITRESLYNEVWAEPMTTVAARYDVSGNYLARICEMLNVPHPPRGYWAQRQVGTAAPRPELPPATGDHPTLWERGAVPYGTQSPVGQQLPAPGSKRKWSRPAVHPLVVNVASQYKPSYNHDAGYLRPRKRGLPDLFVSEKHLEVGLHLASELYLALEDCGYKVAFATGPHLQRHPSVDHRETPPKANPNGYDYSMSQSWSPSRQTVVAIGALAIGLTVYELSTSVAGRYYNNKWTPLHEIPEKVRTKTSDWVSHHDVPSGRFCIRAYSPYGVAEWQQEWREHESGDLLKRLKKICREIESAAPSVVLKIAEGERKAAEQHARWERERAEAAEREAERLRSEAHATSRKELLEAIDAWSGVMRLESFFADVERRLDGLPEEERPAVRLQLQRARGLIGSTDALERFRKWRNPDEMLDALRRGRRWY